MDNLRLAVLGGDARQDILYNLLKEEGYNASRIPAYQNEIIIGPIPFSKDGINIYQVSGEKLVNIEKLFRKMRENTCPLLIAGAIKASVRALAEANAIEVIDLMDLDEVAVMNAVPTAEGTIAAAMENSDITLSGSRCLVLGYGRCGKILAHMLKGLGALVSAEARSAADEAYIKSYGLDFVHLNDLEKRLNEFEFIINTIPAMIINRSALEFIQPGCLLIDISSGTGGIDLQSARQMGIKALNLPGLPGKAAPRTAAKILKDAITRILVQRGY